MRAYAIWGTPTSPAHEEWVDQPYVRRRSFAEDLRILALTVRAVAGKVRRTPADG